MRSSLKRLLATTALGSILLISAVSFGDTTKRETPTAREERLYNEGTSAARAGRWAEARDRFREAFAIQSRPQIAGLLGKAELELGENQSAAEHLSFFLREEKGISAEDRKRAEELLAAAKSAGGASSSGADGNSDKSSSVSGGVGSAVAPMSSGLRWTIGGVGLLLAAVGAGAGTALWFVADDARGISSRASYNKGSLAAFGVGAVFGIGTGLFALVTAPSNAPAPKVAILPWVSPSAAGFGVVGVF